MCTGITTSMSCFLEHAVSALSVNPTFRTKVKYMSLLFLLDSQDRLIRMIFIDLIQQAYLDFTWIKMIKWELDIVTFHKLIVRMLSILSAHAHVSDRNTRQEKPLSPDVWYAVDTTTRNLIEPVAGYKSQSQFCVMQTLCSFILSFPFLFPIFILPISNCCLTKKNIVQRNYWIF